MQFERLIKYLDYMEAGERVRGAGFLKLMARNGSCDLEIQVNGMHATDTFGREVFLVTEEGEVPLQELLLKEGRGSLKLCGLHCESLAETGVPYEKLLGIRIPVAAGREICGVIREGMPEKSRSEEPRSEEPRPMELEPVQMEELSDEEQYEEVQVEQALDMPDNFMPDYTSTGLSENKWKQLCAIYPHIAPFKDEREYLSIGPGDFVILSEKYYRMANNSFLLHGYYNYRHLILCRVPVKGKPVYYIGVPGNYFEREKEVAVLFGFESFECAQEPARSGEYGYYMMRVEL